MKALIVYASRSGQTKTIAELIAEGVRFGGGEAVVTDVAKIGSAEDLGGYDAYVFGSATYHGDMIESMKRMLFLAEKAGLTGKVGGSFGSYGWSGEAVERIFETMRHIFEMNMVSDALRLKSAAIEGGMPMAQDYGREVVAKAGS